MLLHHVTVNMTLQLSESSKVVEACADEFVDVWLHRLLAVEQNTEVVNNISGTYDN